MIKPQKELPAYELIQTFSGQRSANAAAPAENSKPD
jgi:hypothetical protein